MSLDEWRMAYQQDTARARSGEYGYCKCNGAYYDRKNPKHCRVCEKPHKLHYLEAKRKGGRVHQVVTITEIDFNKKIIYFSGSEHLQSAPLSNVVGDPEIGMAYEFTYNFLTDPLIFPVDYGKEERDWLESL